VQGVAQNWMKLRLVKEAQHGTAAHQATEIQPDAMIQ
jgi:hypothetical protein